MVTERTSYEGREQTQLKHLVLRMYLSRWGFKLGSVARSRPTRLWFVDCFAGPWRARDEDLEDTSASISLTVMNDVVAEWRAKRGRPLEVGALYVESDRSRFEALQAHVRAHQKAVHAHVLHGEFAERVPEIARRIGNDAAFVFVDPTGWKGAALRAIAPLAKGRYRDVMVNVMYDYINRFKGEQERPWLRSQIAEFFGLEDNEQLRGLDEEGLLEVYRDQLRRKTGLNYALEMAVPKPLADRTMFHLVLGCGHRAAVELFREVEARVIGREAPAILEGARRARDRKDGQTSLEFDSAPRIQKRYVARRDGSLEAARARLPELLRSGPRRYGELWPPLLEELHLTKRDLNELVVRMVEEGALEIEGMTARERSPKDRHRLRLPPTG